MDDSHRTIATLQLLARLFFAVAMVAFGIQHLAYREFVTRLVPKLPAWLPAQPFLACLVGIGLIVAGASIFFDRKVRPAMLFVAGLGLVSFLFLYLPRIAADPRAGGMWTNAGKALMLAGGAFLVAGSLDGENRSFLPRHSSKLIPWGRLFVSAFLILTGIQHFIYAPFVATLVPAWIPGHLFWTYFAGVALIAGGIGMLASMTRRLAAFLSGIMIFLWVLLLHIPRAAARPHDTNETTAVFEALAISGAALLVAATSQVSKSTMLTMSREIGS